MEEFKVEIAGVPLLIRCRWGENRAFFRDYLSRKEPRFLIAPEQEDLENIRSRLSQRAPAEPSPAYLENNAIHALLAERLVWEHVLLVHGSALCMDGQAYLFTAKSGTGKSTHARLWRERFGGRVWMLNDDKPMLRVQEGRVTVYGTPWNGKHRLSRNASAPLKAVALLERAGETRVSPLSGAEALPRLMEQALRARDPETMGQILELERELLTAVPFYRLSCTMDPEAAEIAWRAMQGE